MRRKLVIVHGCRVLVWDDENIFEMDGGDGVRTT